MVGLRRRILDAKVGHDSHLRADNGRISFPMNPDKQKETGGTLQSANRRPFHVSRLGCGRFTPEALLSIDSFQSFLSTREGGVSN